MRDNRDHGRRVGQGLSCRKLNSDVLDGNRAIFISIKRIMRFCIERSYPRWRKGRPPLSAPASEVIAPPSNATTTSRPSCIGITEAIETCTKPYAAVATDLATGREIWLRSESMDEAVRASIALLGIFSPTRIGDQWLVDGGLSNPVPVSVCRALGAEIIIAVNLHGDLLGRRFETEFDPERPPSPFEFRVNLSRVC
jgi:predicted acylesterase/phospholipase RssA